MHLEPPTGAGLLLGVCTVLVVVFLFVAHFSNLKQKVSLFYCWLGAIAVLGGAAAFFLPIAVNSGFAKDDDGSALRQALLYTTGGLLGVITLGETHRRNNQEKEKNENDHTRQVHAERRSRYAKAVEQLANEKAAVRLGGIYTLVGLVDEWIADETLTPENQQKEGQVIINSLCSYIRSPFSLAIDGNIMAYDGINYDMPPEDYEGDYRADQAKLIDEQDTRISIFKEISSRINNEILSKNDQKHWNNFSYNFSRSVIFYPLRNLSFSGADFSFTIFIGDTGFESSEFLRKASFAGGYFKDEIAFRNAYFKDGVDFSHTNFEVSADFKGLQSTGSVIFELSKLPYDTDFSESYFPYNCNHIWNFIQRKDKPGVKYGSTDLILPNNEVITKYLPAGARLFDPDSWDEEKQKYTRVSDPAKPLENSDTEEEKPTE
ncbi:pentapeptide repeat-containing protein [uncultured Rothia sp.]|uniref:pentapeptide repeat-containing protein n=1 Tax=uncultured Rothia sp. TaxID=316088 RepID=UPI002608B4E5|nr:pentapeptide repeat-containing protein [uncultured Rothia sp.]